MELISQKAQENNKIKIIANTKNIGSGLSRNKCIDNAIGDYIAFLDSDDFWLRNKLETQLNFMLNNGFLFSCSSQYDAFSSFIRLRKCKLVTNYKKLLYENSIYLSTVIIKKEKLIKFKKMRREDHYLWYKITSNHLECYGLQKPLTVFNCTNVSQSSNKLKLIKHSFNLYNRHLKFSKAKSLGFVLVLVISKLKQVFLSKKLNSALLKPHGL